MSAEDDAATLEYGTLSAKGEVLMRLLVQSRENVTILLREVAEWKRNAQREHDDCVQRSTRKVPSPTPRTGPSFLTGTSGAWCFGERVRSMAGSVSQVVCTQDDYWQFITHYNTIGSECVRTFGPELGSRKEAAAEAGPQEEVTYENLGPAYGAGVPRIYPRR